MKSREIGRGSTVSLWIVRLVLLAWLGLLIVWAHRANTASVEVPVWSINSRAALLALVRHAALSAFTSLVQFLPVGFLAVLSLPSRDAWVDRIVRSWLPAVVGSFLLAMAVQWFQPGSPFVTPGVPGLLLPWTGCLIGCWAGMAWTRGRSALLLFLAQLALVFTLFVGGLGVLLYRAVDSAPLSLETPSVTSAEKRRLYGLFAGKNPLKIEEGKTVELRLTARDLNLLLAWGLSVGESTRSARVELAGNRARLLASVPIPARSRYLNITALGGLNFAAGRLKLQAERLRIGRIEIPTFLLESLSSIVSRAVNDDSRVKPILQLLQGINLQSGAVTLTYGHGAAPKGFVAGLFHDSSAGRVDIPVIKAQILNLLAAAGKMPSNSDARFSNAVQTAFRFAQDRSTPDRAANENRDAVLALGIVLGHPRVETLIGAFLDEPTRNAVRRSFGGTTLRKREDWPKHFFVSAALTVIAAGNVSNATGLFKEEKDAAGGSGFSFGDLLADRSGTTFAEVATRNEASARALQERLARGFNVDDFFPQAQGLPENLQDSEFEARYGGVGGKGYLRLMAEIERRVSSCAAYRESL